MGELQKEQNLMVEKVENSPWSKNGGKRKGSGRKQKEHLRKNFQAREELYKWIDENWEALMKGLKVSLDKEDKEMIKYLIDQRIGKAPQRVEMTGEEGKPLSIQIIRYDGNSKDTTSPVSGQGDIQS